MGKSETIKSKEESNEEFQKFMDKLSADAKNEEEKLYSEIMTRVNDHYDNNGWTHGRFFGERRSDYQNYSNWGLERINKIIDTIASSLSKGDFPSNDVPGSDGASEGVLDEAKNAISLFAGDYSLIIARVKALVTGALTQFAVEAEASRKSEIRDMPLAGGLHLFFASSGKVYKESSFFSSQFIGSFQIVFEAHMSAAEARAIGLQQILATTDLQLKSVNETVVKIQTAQDKKIQQMIDSGNIEDLASTKRAYKKGLNLYKKDQAELQAEYDKYNQVKDTVDQLFDHLEIEGPGIAAGAERRIALEDVFDPWEAQLARRYIKERLAG